MRREKGGDGGLEQTAWLIFRPEWEGLMALLAGLTISRHETDE